MDTKSALIALLDANVLYPASLRSFMLYIAAEGLFEPKWTDAIQDEWILNVLEKRKDLKMADLERVKSAMNGAFPDANVIDYEELIAGLKLPDKKDRHVLAAAIKESANLIVTHNQKDFPNDLLQLYKLELCTPDELVMHLLDMNTAAVKKALNAQVKSLKNPPKTKIDVLALLEKNGLKESIKRLVE